jgi:hypothetical protein
MLYDVRPGTVADVPEAVSLVRRIVFDLGYVNQSNQDSYSDDEAKNSFLDYIMADDATFHVCYQGTQLVGLFLAAIYSPFVMLKNFRRAHDVIIQPDPTLTKKQKSKVFLLLLDRYEAWAKEKHATEIFIGVNVRNDITKSLNRKGFKQADFVLKKELDYG